MRRPILFLLIVLTANSFAQKKPQAPVITASKKTVIQSVDNHAAEMISISDKIWAAEETAFNEVQSSKLLADYAEAMIAAEKVRRAATPTPNPKPRKKQA